MPAHAQSLQPSKKVMAKKPASRAGRIAVLHLCPDLEPGDPARAAVDLAILTQRAAGWRALITSSGGLLVPEAERAAVHHTRLPLNSNSLFVNWLNRMKLSALIEKERPALIHAHGLGTALQALAVARKAAHETYPEAAR
jgi:hypothetical protein